MPSFNPETLARWTGGRWTVPPVTPLAGFSNDTRRLRPGQGFVALRTAQRDGHDFLREAAAGGAAAALVARAVPDVALPQLIVADPLRALQVIAREHRRQFPGPVVGITGSAGKTSTKNLLARLLGPAALATEGNLNNFLGVPLTLTALDPERHSFAVIEAGISEPGEMTVLADMIAPDVAIITLVAAAHTEHLGGVAGVAREKAMLAAAVRDGGIAILPAEVEAHPVVQALPVPRLVVERVADANIGTIGVDRLVYAVEQGPEETRVAVRGAAWREPLQVSLPRVTDGMAQNAVLALAAALHLGLDPAEVPARLQGWTPAPLRGEVRREAGRLVYLDCYNANPASMRDALRAFAELAPAPLPRWYVLGGMEELGAESAEHHRQLGEGLELRREDRLTVVGRDADQVARGALSRGARPEQVDVYAETPDLAARLAEYRGAIFVKGSRKYRLEEILVGTPGGASTLGRH